MPACRLEKPNRRIQADKEQALKEIAAAAGIGPAEVFDAVRRVSLSAVPP